RRASGAIADRSGADRERVERLVEEGVEGEDLVHLAPANVHVVGERVGQVGGDGSDLPSDPAEIVEQAWAFARKLGKERRELQDVDSQFYAGRRPALDWSAEMGPPRQADKKRRFQPPPPRRRLPVRQRAFWAGIAAGLGAS